MNARKIAPWRCCIGFLFGLFSASQCVSQPLRHGDLDPSNVHRPHGSSKGLILLLSDDNRGARFPLAESLTGLAYTVAVFDIRASLTRPPDGCLNPADELIESARLLERHYPDLAGKPPIVLGTGSGAALAYAALAYAPDHTFHAGISVDFCPHWPAARDLCPGGSPAESGINAKNGELIPRPTPVTWFVFQHSPACDVRRADEFIARIDSARRVDIAPNAPDPQASLLALLQWLDPGIKDQVSPNTDLNGLPLTEVRVPDEADSRLAIMLSGDGGWAALDRGLAAELAKRGVETVGWDSLSYYWNAKTPEQAATDLARVIEHYTRSWHKSEILLIGYSFGADVLPFLIDRLPPTQRDKIKLAAFLGLGNNASFEFHLSDWLGGGTASRWPTQPEVRKLRGLNRVCVYGEEETDSACPGLASSGVMVIRLPGDHHFGGDYAGIIERLLQTLR